MAKLNFPDPAVNTTYFKAGINWTWNPTLEVWSAESENTINVPIVNVKSYGAVGDGITDDTQAIQAAADAGTSVVFPKGDYLISNSIDITNEGTVLIGEDATILQEDYPQICFYVKASDVSISGFTFKGLPAKTVLTESHATRFNGNLLRNKSTAVYFYYGADNSKVYNCKFLNFIFGIYYLGGQDGDWVDGDSSDPNRMTTTTFRLSSSSQRSNGYWTGGYIRIFANDGTTPYVRITGYDAATNTITFRTAQTVINLLGEDWYYVINTGRTTVISVYDNYFDKMDFGIGGDWIDRANIYDCVFKEIEQTQQTNVRPHSIYITGGDSRLINVSNLVTYKCKWGGAYKFIGVYRLTLSSLTAFASRGVVSVEGCSEVHISDIKLVEGGPDGFDQAIRALLIIACNDVFASDISMSIDNSYVGGGGSNTPRGVEVEGSDDLNRGDLGTMNYDNPIQCNRISLNNISVNTNAYQGEGYVVLFQGTANRVVKNSIVNNYSLFSFNSNQNFYISRFINSDSCLSKASTLSLQAGSHNLRLDDSTEDCVVNIDAPSGSVIVDDRGTNNTIFKQT